MKFLVFDTETTGFGPGRRVIQVGFVFYEDYEPKFHCKMTVKLRSDNALTTNGLSGPRSFNIHGISDAMRAKATELPADWKTYAGLLEGVFRETQIFEIFEYWLLQADVCVGHNLGFDLTSMSKDNLWPAHYRGLFWDTCWCMSRSRRISLKKTYRQICGKDNPYTTHDAYWDAKATGDVMVKWFQSDVGHIVNKQPWQVLQRFYDGANPAEAASTAQELLDFIALTSVECPKEFIDSLNGEVFAAEEAETKRFVINDAKRVTIVHRKRQRNDIDDMFDDIDVDFSRI